MWRLGRAGDPSGRPDVAPPPSPAPGRRASPAGPARRPAAWPSASPAERQPAPQPGSPPSVPWCPWELAPLRETIPQLRLARPSELGQGGEPSCWLQNLPRDPREWRMERHHRDEQDGAVSTSTKQRSPMRGRLGTGGYSALGALTGQSAGLRRLGSRERDHSSLPGLTAPGPGRWLHSDTHRAFCSASRTRFSDTWFCCTNLVNWTTALSRSQHCSKRCDSSCCDAAVVLSPTPLLSQLPPSPRAPSLHPAGTAHLALPPQGLHALLGQLLELLPPALQLLPQAALGLQPRAF